MTLDFLQITVLIIGVIFLGFGVLVLFSKSFLHWFENNLWKENQGSLLVGLFSKNDERFINKYITSIQSILIGVILLLFIFFTL